MLSKFMTPYGATRRHWVEFIFKLPIDQNRLSKWIKWWEIQRIYLKVESVIFLFLDKIFMYVFYVELVSGATTGFNPSKTYWLLQGANQGWEMYFFQDAQKKLEKTISSSFFRKKLEETRISTPNICLACQTWQLHTFHSIYRMVPTYYWLTPHFNFRIRQM